MDKIDLFKEKYKKILYLIIPFLFCILLFGIIYKVCGIKYYINDDLSMRNIASGAFTGTPDAHLIFIKYIIGLLISVLYRMNNSIDWYGLFLIGCHFLCLYFIIQGILRFCKNNKVVFICLSIFIFLVFDLPSIVNFQFTTTAGICSATAIFLLLILPASEKAGGGR